MEKVILFGTGVFGVRTYKALKNKDVEVMCFTDNNSLKWGKSIDKTIIVSPNDIEKYEYDSIVICVNDGVYDAIYYQLREELAVDKDKIRHWTYWLRKDFLDYYLKRKSDLDNEQLEILSMVEEDNRLRAFNYQFVEEYDDKAVCYFDEQCGLYYAIYNGKKLYLSSKYNSKVVAEQYINSLYIEQDYRSPHRYLDDNFEFEGGCIVDAGAAEGNFALELVEKADRVILIEADDSWNEPLRKTFSPWSNKVTIINKYLGRTDDEHTISIDTLAQKNHIDFIKMDIEGAEISALEGGKEFLNTVDRLELVVCTYHRLDDENIIREELESMGYDTHTTNGYMIFPDNIEQPPRMVRGVLRAEKR